MWSSRISSFAGESLRKIHGVSDQKCKMKNKHYIVTWITVLLQCLDLIYGTDINDFFTQDYTYLVKTKALYKLHTHERNYKDAKYQCELEGAGLWFPDDQAEVDAVTEFRTGLLPKKEEILIAITDLQEKGVYLTLDGRSLDDVFNKWEQGEPNDGGGGGGDAEERCLILKKKVLNDHRCSQTFPFVCKKSLKDLQCINKGENPGTEQNYFLPKYYTYLSQTNNFYKLHTTQRNVTDAEIKCKMEGATFWYPENQAEVDAVIGLWQQQQPVYWWIYIAINDFKVKGMFETIDGRPINEVFNKWEAGEPNGANFNPEERCVILRANGGLNDNRCDRLFPFVCKKPLDNLDCTKSNAHLSNMAHKNPGDKFFPRDYTYIKEMKSFYKVHTIHRNVTMAEERCKIEGSTFWFPENQAEADAVIAFWTQTQPFYWIYIGVNDFKNKGYFETIDGRSIDDVYNKWDIGEPNDGGTAYHEERCVTLRKEGFLNDFLCDRRYPFICKKPLGDLCNYKCDLPNFGNQITANFFRKDYTYVDKTKSLYKIHTVQRNAADAENRCKMEGATFWYPENQAEVDAVLAFWNQTQPKFELVHIAVNDLRTKGIYMTNDGRSLDDIFHVWGGGEPNNGHGGPEERCLVLKLEGVLHDHVCSRKFPFICKKTLDSFCTDQCNNPKVSVPSPTRRPQPATLNIQPQDVVSSITTSVQCGVVAGGNNRPLIFNGIAYARGEWPWVVALYRKRQGSLSYICSGTLVSDRHVVTAAHCMLLRNVLTSKRDVIVKVGVYDLEDWGDDITVPRGIASATIHENYNSSTLANDIMVLTLSRSVEFNVNIIPACLWSGNPELNLVIGATGVVAGWGQSELGPEGTGVPRIVRLPVVTTAACRASRPDFHKLTSEFTLCAGDRNGAGPCLGDSGGGFYMVEKGRWQLRGIVSLSLRSDNGDNTCNLNEYVVFTDAAKYVDWIRKVMGRT